MPVVHVCKLQTFHAYKIKIRLKIGHGGPQPRIHSLECGSQPGVHGEALPEWWRGSWACAQALQGTEVLLSVALNTKGTCFVFLLNKLKTIGNRVFLFCSVFVFLTHV